MARTRYVMLHRNKWITQKAKSVDDFIAAYAANLALFRKYKRLGVKLDRDGVADDYATFYTYDPALAKRLGFAPEPKE